MGEGGREVRGLIDLAKDDSVQGRAVLASAVSDLYFSRRDDFSERETALMSEILHRLIRDVLVRDGGRTAVMATHNLLEAETVCDRVAVIDQGRITGHGTVDELCSATRATTLSDVFESLTTSAAMP